MSQLRVPVLSRGPQVQRLPPLPRPPPRGPLLPFLHSPPVSTKAPAVPGLLWSPRHPDRPPPGLPGGSRRHVKPRSCLSSAPCRQLLPPPTPTPSARLLEPKAQLRVPGRTRASAGGLGPEEEWPGWARPTWRAFPSRDPQGTLLTTVPWTPWAGVLGTWDGQPCARDQQGVRSPERTSLPQAFVRPGGRHRAAGASSDRRAQCAGTVWKDPEAARPSFQAGGLHAPPASWS